MGALLARAWHGVVGLVFLFGLSVSLALATGYLDPVGFAYYGIGASQREPVLFLLLAAFQAVFLVDATVLAVRRRGGGWWAGLGVAAMALPFLVVVSIARLDLWLAGRRSLAGNVVAGSLMISILVGAFGLRRWAWRSSGSGGA